MYGSGSTISGNDFTGVWDGGVGTGMSQYTTYLASQIGNTVYLNESQFIGFETQFNRLISIYTLDNSIVGTLDYVTPAQDTLNELPQDTDLHIGFGGTSSLGYSDAQMDWMGTREGPVTSNGIIITDPVKITFGSLLNVS